jgi:hypothetical protein
MRTLLPLSNSDTINGHRKGQGRPLRVRGSILPPPPPPPTTTSTSKHSSHPNRKTGGAGRGYMGKGAHRLLDTTDPAPRGLADTIKGSQWGEKTTVLTMGARVSMGMAPITAFRPGKEDREGPGRRDRPWGRN